MFSKSVDPILYFAGAIAISVASGFLLASIAKGFIILGVLTMLASTFK